MPMSHTPIPLMNETSPEVYERIKRWAQELQTTTKKQVRGRYRQFPFDISEKWVRRINVCFALLHFPPIQPAYCALGLYIHLLDDRYFSNTRRVGDGLKGFPVDLYGFIIQWNDQRYYTFQQIGHRIELLLQDGLIRTANIHNNSDADSM